MHDKRDCLEDTKRDEGWETIHHCHLTCVRETGVCVVMWQVHSFWTKFRLHFVTQDYSKCSTFVVFILLIDWGVRSK